jgi:hypothetical protein
MPKPVTLKQLILDAVDMRIDLAHDNINCYLQQDTPFTDNDERNLRECQEDLITWVKFSKALAADGNYNRQLLAEIFVHVLEMEVESTG